MSNETNLGDSHLFSLVGAMGDPIRNKLLIGIADRKGEGITVRELADQIRESRRRVRYHLDLLVKQSLVYIASERRRRGVVERSYRAHRPPLVRTDQIEALDGDQNQKISIQALRAIFADVAAAARAKTFHARPGHSVIRVPGVVDSQGWRDLTAIHDDAMEAAQDVIAESEGRLRESDEPPIAVISASLQFELPSSSRFAPALRNSAK
jgi:DNA-binding transcriptional ArsR family regulator